jgi:hypothetical protein
VKDGATYDVKDRIKDQIGLDTKIGNNWYEYSTAGNILYGFYGKAAGFTELELRAGAGAAQIRDHIVEGDDIGIWQTYYDTEDDYAAVGLGMFLYDNYYKKDKKLTKADLLDALESYENANKMALVNKPKDYQPRYYEYRVDRFYQME